MCSILFIIHFSFATSSAQSTTWEKSSGYFSSTWTWQEDKSTTLIKKTSSLNDEIFELEAWIDETYKTKAEDLAIFRITDWKIFMKEKQLGMNVYSGSYLSARIEKIFWVEFFHFKNKNLTQCLITSPHKINQQQKDQGAKICAD